MGVWRERDVGVESERWCVEREMRVWRVRDGVWKVRDSVWRWMCDQ